MLQPGAGKYTINTNSKNTVWVVCIKTFVYILGLAIIQPLLRKWKETHTTDD